MVMIAGFKTRPSTLIAGILAAVAALALLWYGFVVSALLSLYLGYLGLQAYRKLQDRSGALARLKAERAGEDFQTFLTALNRPAYDPRIVRQVYVAIRSMAGFDARDIALRPQDDLVRDLRIAEEDLDEALWEGLKGPLGLDDSPDAVQANPYQWNARSVGGLVDFYASQARLPEAS